jgi:arylsulfatase A-like enzyme
MKARLAAALCAWITSTAAARQPDILFIVTDDQRPDTIHALGNETIQTPHLDRLVARSSVFTRAIAGYPICHVSRAELLTGCCAFRALPGYPGGSIDPKLATLAPTFQEAGYTTCYAGKWHNDGQPKTRGYTITSGLFSSGGAKGAKGAEVDTQGHPVTGYTGWTFKTDDGAVETHKGIGLTPRTSEFVADGAIDFIKRKHDKPFLLHVNFTAPHDPRLMPPGYEGRYDPKKIPLPGSFARQHPFDHGNIHGRDEVLLKKPLDEDDLRRELACYYAVITHMDEQIGRILAAVEAGGGSDNTIIIFTTDQGLAMGSHGLMGKQNMYEHTLGVPLIIGGPNLPAGRRFAAQCYLRDVFPTACNLAGIPIPETVQGRSLVPVLQGRTDQLYPFVVAYFTDTQRMIRDGRWKFARYPKAEQTQLFDLQNDPLELRNLAPEPAHQDRRNKLDSALTTWLRENGDPNPEN